MRRKRGHLAAGLLVLFLTGLVWLRQPGEPVYQGKRLSVWLMNYSTAESTANRALEQAGVNAVPTLLRMLQAQDSKWEVMLFNLAQKQHVIKIRHTPASEQRIAALYGFTFLGGEARDAVPTLMELYERHPSPKQESLIANALGDIGPAASAAVPLLLQRIASANSVVRLSAVGALGKIRADPERVVAVLTKALTDKDPWVAMEAARSLGAYGPEAKSAVPALVKRIKDRNWRDTQAWEAVQAIDTDALAHITVE